MQMGKSITGVYRVLVHMHGSNKGVRRRYGN